MEGDKKSIFIITSRFPFPLEKGDKLRAYHQIKVLSKSYKIILCSVSAIDIKEEWKEELKVYCDQVHVFKLNKIKLLWNTGTKLFSKKPFQIGYFYQNTIHKNILKIIELNKPDLIYCQLVRVAEYVKNIHSIPKTLDYMDALSAGMFKRAEISKSLFKYLLKTEGDRLKVYENKIFDYFDHHTIISRQDRQLIFHPNNSKIKIIPNGVDDYFSQFDSSKINKEYDLVFVGNLSYPPNIESCQFIVHEILPYFKSKGKTVSVLLAGADPIARVLKMAENNQVTVTGWVDDIRTSYCKGKVFVAPLFIGTGLQNKLLEAMALNVPCVTTTLVNNALGATHLEHLLVADDLEQICESIESLLNDELLVNTIVPKAKQFIEINYNWKTTTEDIPF